MALLPHSLRAFITFGLRRMMSMAILVSESSTRGSSPQKRASMSACGMLFSSKRLTRIRASEKVCDSSSCSPTCMLRATDGLTASTRHCA